MSGKRSPAARGLTAANRCRAAALRGKQPQAPGNAARGTLGWLFRLYRQTTAWTDLAQSTRYKREKIMMRVLATAEHQPVSAVNEAAVIAGRERRAATPAAAQAFIDTLHGLFKWAVSMKLAASDPTANVKVKTKSKRKGGYAPWTDEDMAKFEGRWPRGTRERVIFDILAYTGLRIGDVATLGRQHLKQRTIVTDGLPVRQTVISIDSEKTGMRVELPLLPQLKATLDAGPTGDLAFIVTRRGTPWTKGALGTEFVAAATKPPEWSGNPPMACARRLLPGPPRTGRPSASSRPFSAGQGGGWRPFIPKVRTGAGLPPGPSAS